MATNAQRFGTRNLTANLPQDYIGELGRAAFHRFGGNRTRALVQFIEDGAERHDPALAARLKEIRKQFYGAAMLLLFCGTMFSHDTLRAARRGCRARENDFIQEAA